MLHGPDEFKRKYDHRVVHDKVTHARYELVGDMDLTQPLVRQSDR